jgi:hypothetical protein
MLFLRVRLQIIVDLPSVEGMFRHQDLQVGSQIRRQSQVEQVLCGPRPSLLGSRNKDADAVIVPNYLRIFIDLVLEPACLNIILAPLS